ncbi:MAG TPA: hypothetical protein GXX54_07340 [Clostridiales bacterium]|nr:hypothetical protein [Clostridiales bacterium]
MIIDGEMPWGADKQINNGAIDGFEMAKRLQKFHFTTLSVVHNYKESSIYSEYNMAKWKSIEVNEGILNSNGLRFAPSWLKDQNGRI